MKNVSRRTLVKTVVGGALVGLVLPLSAKADQPHMHEALEALRNAKRELESATQDKGGHRAKALRLVNDAIGEVERGVEYDRHH